MSVVRSSTNTYSHAVSRVSAPYGIASTYRADETEIEGNVETPWGYVEIDGDNRRDKETKDYPYIVMRIIHDGRKYTKFIEQKQTWNRRSIATAVGRWVKSLPFAQEKEAT